MLGETLLTLYLTVALWIVLGFEKFFIYLA